MEKGASCEASVAVSVCVLATTLWFSLAHSEEQKGVVRLPTVTVEGTPETPERTRGESQARKESQRTPREAGGLLGWAVSKTASCD